MRYLSPVAVALAGAAAGSPAGVTAVTTKVSGAVSAGEVLTFHEGGAIRRTDPTLPLTLTNNNAQTLNADLTFAGTASLSFGSGVATLGANRTITVTATPGPRT